MVLPSVDHQLEFRAAWRRAGAVVVFPNGCVDVLHRGHVELAPRPRAQPIASLRGFVGRTVVGRAWAREPT